MVHDWCFQMLKKRHFGGGLFNEYDFSEENQRVGVIEHCF